MTCREKLKMEHPEKVNNEAYGGCEKCPHHYGYLEKPEDCAKLACDACWDREIPGTEPTPEEPKIDIHKIIDDAMEKGDRSVSIYIGQSCVTVNVTPYEKEEPARWILRRKGDGWPYECSACGVEAKYPWSYCPHCGEQMKMPKEEENDD